jgi:uncharacterized phage protein gp47/JayE
LTIPSYQDILNLLTGNAQAIYGPGEYLGTDSALYQLISVFSLAVSDQANALQLAYNNISPVYAVGGALSTIVAYNGMARKAASYSTVQVTITGTAGTVIANGQVRDLVPQQGYLWNLPTAVTIGSGGSVVVTATCSVIGAVQCLAGQISGSGSIATPTAGWTGVSNASAASPGQPVETDSQLRTRQAVSVELPSITMLAGTLAAVLSVSGVTLCLALENPTGSAITTWPPATSGPNYYGPDHSITVVVQGGSSANIAQAIYNNRGIGPATNGTTTVNITDPNSGQTFAVNFYLPTQTNIAVTVNAHGLTPAFTTAVQTAIQTAVVNYLTSLSLGGTVSWAALMATAMSVAGNLESPIYDITSLFVAASTTPPSSGTSDIPMTNPWDVSYSQASYVAVNSV